MHNNSSTSSFVLRRCAAFLYDGLLLIAMFFVFTALAIALNNGQAIHNNAFKFVLYLITYVFFSWFWRHGGQTLGMQAWRIKVVSETDNEISHSQCLKRFLTGTFLFGITLVFARFNTQGKGIHDYFSSTKIINISKS